MLMYGVLLCWLSTSACVYACNFPPHWRDSWVINGYGNTLDYEISSTTITSKGRCLMSKGENRYLLVKPRTNLNNEQTVCYMCMVFTVRHVNVIQFKEKAQCNPTNTDDNLLDRLCGEINNGYTLHTLIRKHAIPIACPQVLQRNLKFKYDKGEDDCISDSSAITPCASNKRLQMTFGQCQERGYPMEEAEIQCLANWKGSGGDWLYVKYGNDSYRCMYYDSSSEAMGMSQDASCTGISIIYDASIFIQWTEDFPLSIASEPCNYPSWFSQREWSDLEAKRIYRYDLSTNELVVDKLVRGVVRYTETIQRLTCDHKVSEGVDEERYITKVINGCARGYQCLNFKKKSDTVIELVIGAISNLAYNACSQRKLISPTAQKRILIDSNAEPVPCPITGVYQLQPQTRQCSFTVEMGCSSPSTITLKECDMIKSELLCLASWKEEKTQQLIISKKSYPRSGNCYSYKVENSDVVIEIDEKCNNGAPGILDSTYRHPHFRLPPAIKQCKGSTAVKPDLGKEYQTQDKYGRSSSNNLTINKLFMTLYTVIMCTMSTSLRH